MIFLPLLAVVIKPTLFPNCSLLYYCFLMVFTNASHFILAMRFSFGDAPGEWLVEAVNLVGVVSFLCDRLGVELH